MNAKLVVVGGEAKAAEIKLKLPTVIGRGREVSLTLPHPLVSRRHCEIFASNGKLYVRDLGSLNGTFVNNERIEGDVEIPSGELLTVGSVTFRAVYDDDPQLRPPTEANEQVASSGNETVRDPGAVTVDVGSGVAVDEAIDDEEFADFVDVDEDEEADELGEVEDWDELDELEDVDLEGSEINADDQDLRSTKPARTAQDQAKPDEDDDAGDDELNAFFKGLG